MISYILFALAAICNAVMDTLVHHYNKSIFTKLNAWFWDATISWTNKYIDHLPTKGLRMLIWKIHYPVQLTDAWHLFKSIMIVLLVLGAVLYEPLLGIGWDFLTIGIIWNLTFNLFYNKILRKK